MPLCCPFPPTYPLDGLHLTRKPKQINSQHETLTRRWTDLKRQFQ